MLKCQSLHLLAQSSVCGVDDQRVHRSISKASLNLPCGLKSTDPKHLCLGKFMITLSTENHCPVVKNITANDMGCD